MQCDIVVEMRAAQPGKRQQLQPVQLLRSHAECETAPTQRRGSSTGSERSTQRLRYSRLLGERGITGAGHTISGRFHVGELARYHGPKPV